MSTNKPLIIPIVLSCIAFAVWLGAAFIGFVYTDNTFFVACLFALALLILIGLGLCLLIWTTQTRSLNQGPKRIIRTISWIIYICGSLVSFYFLNHAVKVVAEVKDEVQQDFYTEITDFQTVYSENSYTSNSYAEYYHKQLDYFAMNLNSMNEPDKVIAYKDLKRQIEETLLDSLDINSSYKLTRAEVLEKTDYYKNSIVEWNPFSVNSVIDEFNRDKIKWKSYMDKFYTVTQYTAETPFEYSYHPVSGSYGKIRNTGFSIAWQAIVVAIILQIIMLLPVLLTIDWSRRRRPIKDVKTV